MTGVSHLTDLLDECMALRVNRRPPHGAVVLHKGGARGDAITQAPSTGYHVRQVIENGRSPCHAYVVLGKVLLVMELSHCCFVIAEPAKSRRVRASPGAAGRERCARLCGGKACYQYLLAPSTSRGLQTLRTVNTSHRVVLRMASSNKKFIRLPKL